MSSATDWKAEAVKGFVTGLCIALAISFAVGAAGVLLSHLCVVPVAPWCSW